MSLVERIGGWVEQGEEATRLAGEKNFLLAVTRKWTQKGGKTCPGMLPLIVDAR